MEQTGTYQLTIIFWEKEFDLASITQASAPAQETRIIKTTQFIKQNWALFTLAAPAVILIVLFHYVPMFGSVIAFENYSPRTLFSSPWVGLRNFELLANSPVLVRILRNTLLLNALFITATTSASVIIALMLNEIRFTPYKRLLQAVMFLPFFMGWTIVAMVMFGLVDFQFGTLNAFFVSLGFERMNLTGSADPWPIILMLIRIWKGTGAGSIIYLAVITSIDPQLYEAAAIDGASRWQRVKHVTLPAIIPVIILLVLLDIGRIFYGDVGMIYAVIGDKATLYPTTDVIDTYVLRALRQNANYGITAAVGLIQSALGFILILGSNWTVKKYSERRGEDYALF